jgi:hypothetical protein
MTTEDKESLQDQESAQHANTPQSVISNTARFNKQFLDSQLGGNPAMVSIGRMLTVMSEQDNTIRMLSKILGREHNDQHLHEMHNSIFGDPSIGTHSIGKQGMPIGTILNQVSTFIHEQNQQIQALIDEIRKTVKQISEQTQS